MIERDPIRFSKWTPVARDQRIGYSYVRPSDGRTHRSGTDRWMRAKTWIASSALASGAETFRVRGGVGSREWKRDVLVSQEEALAFFDAAILRGAFTLRGTYEKALAARERRLAREATS